MKISSCLQAVLPELPEEGFPEALGRPPGGGGGGGTPNNLWVFG